MRTSDRLIKLETQLEDVSEKLDRLLGAMEGSSGMVVRLDRMEQAHARVKVYTHVVASVALTTWVTKVLPAIFTILR